MSITRLHHLSTTMRQASAWVVGSLLALALTGLAGEWTARRETGAQTSALTQTLELQALGLRSFVKRYSVVPFLAAQLPSLQALLDQPNSAVLEQAVNQQLESLNRRMGSEALYLMDLDGLTIAASNWNERFSFVGDSYWFGPYFHIARKGESAFYFAVGTGTGVPGLYIAAPVRHGDVVVGVLAIKVSLKELAETWSRAQDPVAVLDESGIVFLGSEPRWLYTASRPLEAIEVQRLAQEQKYGPMANFEATPWVMQRVLGESVYQVDTSVNSRSRHFLALDEPISEFNWTLVVMADRSPIVVARWMGMLTMASIMMALTVGIFLWRLRERRYQEQRRLRSELEVQVLERTQQLHEAFTFRRAMEDSVLVGMRARDLTGRISYVNAAFCEITGYSADELVGQLPPHPYWHPDDTQKYWHEFDTTLKGEADRSGFESRIRHHDGHDVYTLIYSSPLVDANGTHQGWMSSIVDISAQKRAEDQRNQNIEQMRRSGALSTLGEMASTLAHEISQPLQAVAFDVSTARKWAERRDTEMLVQCIDSIASQTRRVTEIVQQIRGIWKPSGLQSCPANEIILNVLAFLRSELRQRATSIQTDLDPDLPPLLCDRVKLEQVVLNLVINAAQAMHDVPANQRVIKVVTACDGGVLTIRVLDRGAGIPESAREKLFNPFFTTKPDGVGLGLSICRTVVESHGGTLSFENRVDGGASFSIQLPLHA